MITKVLAILGGLLTVALRLLPHSVNFTPIGGLGIYSGARLRGWHRFAFPVAVLFITDLALWIVKGFDPAYSVWHSSRLYVYPAIAAYALIGCWIRNRHGLWVLPAAALGSLQFFLVTNFGEWLLGPEVYPHTLTGLLDCYLAALPFYHWGSLAGDLIFSGVLFGAHALLATREEAHCVAMERLVR